MRWDGQVVGGNDGALPGLALSGLLRSVRTPDFAGVTFHEVAAKSALNKVPAASRVPFRWTINPMRGCLHACTYCLSGETLILMADGPARRLDEIAAGDVVIGTVLEGTYRRYVRSTVRAHWQTRKRAYRVSLRDGTTLVASGDHRFLTERGWKHVTGSGSGAARRPHLTLDNSLMGFGTKVATMEPASIRRRLVDGVAVKNDTPLDVVGIEDLGCDMPMVDITTDTGDFVANGVISHNCFARPTHEYLDLDAGKDFETQIVVKTNVVEVLRAELRRPSWRREHVALGTNTDPYQRAEGRYRLMPGIIEALAGTGTPLSVLTKGTLLRRDLPLLAEAARSVPFSVAISLAVVDEVLQQAVEPGTPTPRARLELVKAVRDAGLPCAVLVAPVMPWLTDSVEHLDELLGRLAQAGATGVTILPLHLRGSVKPWFLRWLAEAHPRLVAPYRRLYGSGAYVPAEYNQWLHARVDPLVDRYGFARGTGLQGATSRAPGDVGEEVGAVGPQTTLF